MAETYPRQLTTAPAVAQHHTPISTGAKDHFAMIQKFLGPPPNNPNPSAYDNVAYTNYDLPEFYKGRNFFVRDTIEGYITEDISWYTTACLPWAFTEEIHIKFNEWKFNQVFADRVPHEGIPRLVTSSKREFQDHTVRKGLAFILEADFYTTPEGQEHFFRNVRGIAQCVQVTASNSFIMRNDLTHLF